MRGCDCLIWASLIFCSSSSVLLGCWPWPPMREGGDTELLHLVYRYRQGKCMCVKTGAFRRVLNTACRIQAAACCHRQHAAPLATACMPVCRSATSLPLCACQATIRDLKDVRTGSLYVAASQTVGVYDMPRLIGALPHCWLHQNPAI